jgi:hypothetical protein
MAIDVLSRPNCIPIIVGDEADMADVVGVGTGAKGEAHLVMSNDQGKTQKVPLSPKASENFMTVDHVLLVSLTPDDQIASAYKMPMNNADGEMQALDEPQIKELAEALVAGDFNLDFLR